ncbi:AfsR/SARP family transcriptional regulator [Actinoplanes sp. NPDC051861]|uniref:AfsR/SARP family transcriptional regulator n=1 Tax=Actinoplanes sp. NPDC051861 TaxID=3155170 RepID=UPI0034290AF4
MEFSILGPVCVLRDDGSEVSVPGAKPRTVLATLLLARGEAVPDARLSGFLWGRQAPRTAGAQLYTYISRLRKRLGGAVRLDRQDHGYRLRIVDGRFDVDEFTRLAALGEAAVRDGRPEEGARALRSALALWRGPALTGVSEHLREAELPQLEEARMTALESRIEADLALLQHQRLIPELTGLVTRYPLRERLRAQWMTALYRCERQADALAVYREGRELLTSQVGVEPGPTLSATHRAVLDGTL